MTIYKPVSRLAARAAATAVAMARHQVIIANGAVNNGFRTFPAFWRRSSWSTGPTSSKRWCGMDSIAPRI